MKKSPSIVLTSKFTLPNTKTKYAKKPINFSGYFDYIKRSEATDLTSNKEKGNVNFESDRLIEMYNHFYNNDEEQSFAGYLNYMSRIDAIEKTDNKNGLKEVEHSVLKKKTKEFEKKFDKENKKEERRTSEDDILNGVFTNDLDEVTGKDMRDIRKKVKQAQENESVLWQDVISFDNKYLEEIGLYNPKTERLDVEKLIKPSRKMMNKLLEKEKLQDVFWMATVHVNTDNIHIHFSTVELNPSRKMQEHEGELTPRGKRKQSTIDDMKMAFGNDLLDNTETYKRLGKLRDMSIEMAKGGVANLEKYKEPEDPLVKIIMELDKTLPDDWEQKVKRNHVSYKYLTKEQKKLVDEGIEILKESNPNFKENYNEYIDLINEHNKKMEDAYGERKDENRKFKEKRKKDLDERLGNVFLKGVGKHKENIIKQQDTLFEVEKKYNKKKKTKKPLQTEKIYKKYSLIDKYFWKMDQKEKRKVEQELSKALWIDKQRTLQGYEEMMKNVERAKHEHELEY